MRYVLKALGEKTIIVMPACCWSVIAGPFPYSTVRVPLLHTAFETAASAASGVRAALDVRGDRETTVLAFAGDGATFDIGLGAVSAAAERNENILYVCYDNEAYMNTGIQRSSATPLGAWTTTTPQKKRHKKKDILGILAAHEIPYAATASVAFPEDVMAKTRRARELRGFRFLHILTPCPPGWKIPSEQSIHLARLAVLSRSFPLVEVFDGRRYQLQEMGPPIPVREYLRAQGRFSLVTPEEEAAIERDVEYRWQRLRRLASSSQATCS